MLIAAQGFDGIFKGIGDAADGIAGAFALLVGIAMVVAFVVMVIVIVICAVSAISVLVHGVVTGTRLVKQRYREKGPSIASPLLTLPGLVAPAVALVFMLKHGVQAEGGIPLALFLLSMAILLFVWFAPWAQHVRAISQDRNVSVGVALRQVVHQNRLRFLMTINLPVLLVSWVTAAISNWTGIPLLLFLLSVGVLLFVWFAWWAQEVRAIRQDRNASISVALGQVIYRNKGRFVMTIVVSLLLVGWLTAAKLESVAREQEAQAQARERKAGSVKREHNIVIAIKNEDRDSARLPADWGQLVAAEFTTVRTITLSGPGVTSAVVADLQTLPELEELSLVSAELDDQVMPYLAKIKTLKRLTIEGNITDRGLQALQQMPQLTDLDVSQTAGTDKGMQYLSGLVQLQSLAVPAGVTARGLAHLRNLQLKSLTFPLAARTDIGLEHYLAACEPRTKLDLSDWKGLHGPGLIHLQAWPTLSRLTLNMGDVGMPHVGQLSSLEYLELSSSGVTDAAVEHLSRLRNLKTLTVSRTSITTHGAAELGQALTGCAIKGVRSLKPRPSRIDRETYQARFPALEFDGVRSYLAVPSFKYDGSHSLTVEAWVWCEEQRWPNRKRQPVGTILGNTESAGFSLALDEKQHLVCWFRGVRKYVTPQSDSPLPIRQWCHVAFVYDGQTVTVFVNGFLQRKIATVSGRHRSSRRHLMIGAEPNQSNHPSEHFSGAIREVRLSRTVRYRENFTPAERFQADSETLALYHLDVVEGNTTPDASGQGHPARLHGAKWLDAKAVDTP